MRQQQHGPRDHHGPGANRPPSADPEPAYQERFEKSPVAQAVCDRGAVLVDVNPAFARLLDLPPERITGRPIRELSHRLDPGSADRALAKLLDGAIEATQAERILRRADGRPVPTLASATAVRDGTGRPTGAVVLYQDLSALHSVVRRRRQQEDFHLAIAQRASDVGVVLDPTGTVLFASPAIAGVLGHAPEDVVARDGAGYVHPDDLELATTVLTRVITEGGTQTSTLRLRDHRGGWPWMELTATNLLDTAVGGVVCNLHDVTDRVRAEAALRASERRYRAIADHADEGLWVTGPDGRTAYVNQRLVEILGLAAEEIVGRPALEVLDPRDQPLARLLAPTPPEVAGRQEVTYRHPDGGPRSLMVATAPLDDAGGAVEGTLAMVTDVTEARRLERELREAALHDSLTGLPNRALLRDRLEQALARETGTTGVLLVDLDRFRVVNEDHGHAVGDDLLTEIGSRLRTTVRATDTVGRFGADQFLIICEDVDGPGALAAAEDVLAGLAAPVAPAGGLTVTASAGLAMSPAPSAGTLVRRAEMALRVAKTGGRGRVQVYDAEAAARAEQRLQFGAELAGALAADELELHFQPVVDLRSGAVVGVEALSRWHHRVLGPVPPQRFVEVAEAEGLATTLDGWVVDRALREVAAMRSTGTLEPTAYVAVNLSARSLADPGLEERVTAATSTGGLAPEDVVLEVTESATMTDAAAAADLLGRLRQRGFRVAVDDFGTGHSSLAYLRRLPVSVLKVDRSFVREIDADGHARAITASIIDLARTMGLAVVAEGVESPGQAEVLRSLGADAAQGWLWSPAVSPAEAARSGALCRSYASGSGSSSS